MSFKPSQKNEQDFNGGTKYKNGDGLHADTVNNVIESLLWSQSIATNQPNIENINGDGTPSVSIEEVDGLPRFKFQNLKGEKGIDGKVNVVQTLGESETDAMSQKATTVAIAKTATDLSVKKSASGKVIYVDDASRAKHIVKLSVSGAESPEQVTVHVCGKNLIPFPYPLFTGTIEKNGLTITPQEDGGVRIHGTATASTAIDLCQVDFGSNNINKWGESGFVGNVDTDTNISTLYAPTWKKTWINIDNGVTLNNFVFYPQIEAGKVSTEYEKGVEHGVYTPNADGTVDGVISVPSKMTIYASIDATLNVEYAVDINDTISKMGFAYEDYSLPVLYFEGDISAMNKDNAVTLNYIYGDKAGTCTMKWQGSSSLAYPKKNYTVKFDNAFKAKEGWGEQKKYCLKADWIDFSHCRNVVSAKLWGDIVKNTRTITDKRAISPNSGAIDGFPCFVVINGEWKGIYNFNIPKDGWMMDMGEGTKEAIVCAENTNACLFKENAVIGKDYDLEYNSDGWAEADIQASLNNIHNACINGDMTALEQCLDIESAIDHFIFMALARSTDTNSKNYLLSTYDGTKWFFTEYDLDATWGLHWNGKSFLASGQIYDDILSPMTFSLIGGTNKLFALILENRKAEFIARYKTLRKKYLSVGWVSQRFYNHACQIPLPAYNEEAKLWKEMPCTSVNNVAQIISWYQDRAIACDEEVAAMEATLSE